MSRPGDRLVAGLPWIALTVLAIAVFFVGAGRSELVGTRVFYAALARQNRLFVGRFVPLKGIERLMEAVAAMESQKNLQLLLIGGDGPDADSTIRLKDLSHPLQTFCSAPRWFWR